MASKKYYPQENKKTIALFSCLMLSPMLLLARPAKAETVEVTTNAHHTLADSRIITRWTYYRGYSFTELVRNNRGKMVPVRFSWTGDISSGPNPQYYYVGVIQDTDFGVYNKIISDTK